MELTWIDLVVFLAFIGLILFVALWASRKEDTSEDYFLAGRKLTWWLIGFSLLASNISTEHFVGMTGKAFGPVGLAVANWEWMSAIAMVLIAWTLLPRFLRAGIYTMPEFLQYRYSESTRTIMAVYMMVAYVIVLLATVLYSGSIALNTIFDIPAVFASRFGMSPEKAEFWATTACIWTIGIAGGIYTVYGGLTAVVWADLLQGSALLIGGGLVGIYALFKIGMGQGFVAGWHNFVNGPAASKLHVVLPANDTFIPWPAAFLALWIPNIFYWGLNQFITQRALAAKNVSAGQRGMIFAAFLKLMIPFLIIMPGIMSYHLYADKITLSDKAFPYLMNKVLPPQFRGFMFAALGGAIMGCFCAGANSASTIFTMDIYRRHINKQASGHRQLVIGRTLTVVFIIVACLWAPIILHFPGVFAYIQTLWGFISPAVVAAFLVGMVVKRTPTLAANGAFILGIPIYGFCRFGGSIWSIPGMANVAPAVRDWVIKFNGLAFLYHQIIVFVLLVVFMLIVTAIKPLKEPIRIPDSNLIDTKVPATNYVIGGLVIAATFVLYYFFW